MAGPPLLAIRNAYLRFTAQNFKGSNAAPGGINYFDVACGSTPPTITGGYARWNAIQRPLQRSLTIFGGYDPVQMTVNVIFGQWNSQAGWATSDTTGQYVENQIGVLEWMAGVNSPSGAPPVVYVYSDSTGGGQSDLIPPQYQSTSSQKYPWVISGLAWGTAYRNTNMYRVWQEATINLEGYLNLGKPPAPKTQQSGAYFTSRAGRNTALLIAGAPAAHSPVEDHRLLAERICDHAKNNPCKGTKIRLRHKHVSWPITIGTPVWVPDHSIV